MNLNFASIWENTTNLIPDEVAIICGDDKKTWRQYDDIASKLASALIEAGLTTYSKAGLYLHNSNEYLEAQFAIFKIGGTPINVNYRYKADELLYLLDNSDCEALFYQACYGDQINKIKDSLPGIKVWIEVSDNEDSIVKDCLNYNELVDQNNPMARWERPEDIVYMLYTGGTTGMPKGVMYNQAEFITGMFKTLRAMGYELPKDMDKLDEYILSLHQKKELPVSLVGCPLMHGTGMWLGCFVPHNLGGTVATIPGLGFDPDKIWKECSKLNITNIVIVGDAFARPMLDALNTAKEKNHAYDLSSLNQITSSGVMWSAEVKKGLLEHHDMRLMDTFGSTEGGMGASLSTRENTPDTAKFTLNPGMIVLKDDGSLVEPGSDDTGLLGISSATAMIPIGYYKDEKKSAETFREYKGTRYSFPGDYAQIKADGSIKLLGRGSNCINSAGEKIYPEEVEEALKKDPVVFDCLVVGLPDDRFGQKIIAVVSTENDQIIAETDIISNARERLAGYKLPKQIIFCSEVRRAPNGKADYKWAKTFAEENIK
ncbi:AMP-binding protein [Gammaproteobacteria bacterium]|nr:AMP-binding protein [Gammaproteobacteria bacterium]MDC0129426.1 AMP-binding protein [Gammaproteobacteria bacterium]